MSFPVEEKYILRAEEQLGVKFPKSYRHRMSINNGGAVEVGEDLFNLFPIYDDSDRKRITRTCNSVVKETAYERKHNLLDNFVAIGDNGSGDLLVFMINEEGNIEEVVYWIDHEVQELEYVCDSFSELCEIL